MSDKERETRDEAGTGNGERRCCGPGEAPEVTTGCCPDGMPRIMQAGNRMLKMMRECRPDGVDQCDCTAVTRRMPGGAAGESES